MKARKNKLEIKIKQNFPGRFLNYKVAISQNVEKFTEIASHAGAVGQ